MLNVDACIQAVDACQNLPCHQSLVGYFACSKPGLKQGCICTVVDEEGSSNSSNRATEFTLHKAKNTLRLVENKVGSYPNLFMCNMYGRL